VSENDITGILLEARKESGVISDPLNPAKWLTCQELTAKKLLELFYSLIPDRKKEISVVKAENGYKEVYDPRETNFAEGWNLCRGEILRRIKCLEEALRNLTKENDRTH